MKLIHKIFFLLIFLTFISISTPYAVQPPIPQAPSRYVEDLAGIITDAIESQLNGHLQELEQKTTAQMVVLTINSLEGESPEDVSIEIAHNRWKLGQKGKDNGVLLLVALQDKKYRFEIGYGLEGILPDSRVGSIGREYLVPYFRKGDYSTGIFTASLAVISEIATDAGVEITGMPKLRTTSTYPSGERGKPSIPSKILTILFFIGLIYLFIRHPRLLLFLIMMNILGGGRRGSWGGRSNFGGGFGSFGGGVGGGFGGGGASGSW